MPKAGAPFRADVVILGAGLTGLSAALHLQRAGVRYCLLERENEVGGLAVTVEEAGYRFDRTGHLLHLRDPELLPWLRSVLGDDLLTLRRRSRVWSNGVYTRYPFQSNTKGLPARVAYECVLGFVQAHCAPATSEPENFEEFCEQTFGSGFSRHFMLPYNERMWGVPARDLTTAWCQRFVPRPSLEDVVAGAVGLDERELGYNPTFLYPRHGIGTLASAIARELASVELGCAPSSIDPVRRRLLFSDRVLEYQALISTIPLPRLVGLLDSPPPTVQQAAGALRSTRLYYLDVALAGPCRQPWHWVYVPEPRYPFYRVGCYSHFSQALAPTGCANLYVELVDRRAPDLDRLLPEVAAALTEMGLIDGAEQIAFTRLRELQPAYVVFDRAHTPSVDLLQPYLERLHILSTGRYGGWNYSSMEDALRFGIVAARRAKELL